MAPTFSIVTPTYNRAHTLERVYNSLIHQTCHDFEWIIIDDGSTDQTRQIVEKWQRKAEIQISYKWQENQHKKTAVNHGVRLAKGELILIADSDDDFFPEALETYKKHWLAIPDAMRYAYAGIWALCVDETRDVIGTKFPGDWGIDSDYLEIRYRYRVMGEKWGCMRADLMKLYPYPEDVAGHVPEGIVWSAIGQRYQTRFINVPLRSYRQDAGNQLMRAYFSANDAPGHCLWMKSILEYEMRWFWSNPGHFLLSAARWFRFFLYHTTRSYGVTRFLPKHAMARILILIMLPSGVLWYLADIIRRK